MVVVNICLSEMENVFVIWHACDDVTFALLREISEFEFTVFFSLLYFELPELCSHSINRMEMAVPQTRTPDVICSVFIEGTSSEIYQTTHLCHIILRFDNIIHHILHNSKDVFLCSTTQKCQLITQQ